ncbi:hypothetical protein [Staphylococcus nepalensis]|uniref:hypothetical protein n=1 Tax=Staphylococcus nepalensis TaxID=214473 RepID=UPI000DF8F4D3|nr:hypothetical protein [Staphylococcus nepalensis]MDR5650020.1 hypothetical protein [Staphylococcus nepalensis]SUM67705.1 Uncharacterised protein [Staphylococcus nepalensis]SUM95263.1 Uncharacterised protein [Staphylococcus nepalensis]
MRMLMTFITVPFTTITFSTLIQDFYIALVLVIFASFVCYMFFDRHFNEIENNKMEVK